MTERNIMKDPLSEAELRALAKRLGGPKQLIAPKRMAELGGMADGELIAFLANNPNCLRRPLIDTGELVTGGFTADVRERLEGVL